MTDHATPHDAAAAPADATPAATAAEAPATPAPAAPFAPPTAAAPAPGAPVAPEHNPWGAPDATALPPLAPQPSPEELAARRTRRRRAAVRWSAAVLVFALAGTGAALGVTAPERTDLPGLATKNDGRYTFPAPVLPPLPSGKAAPRDSKSRHAADLRFLLLPAPKEAGGSLAPVVFPSPTATASAAGPSASGAASASPSGTPSATASASPSGGPAGSPSASGAATTAPAAAWVPCDAIADEQKEAAKLRILLLQDACRTATVREWTAADGTRTQIRLLGFGSSSEAWDVFADLRANADPKDVPGLRVGSAQGWDTVSGVDLSIHETPAGSAPAGPTGRLAYLSAGDVLGVVTMTNPKGVPTAAFRQVVTLQSDLLA
ncbi:hypothetical protein RMN57_20955 [Kitasatospora sp. CM 4170]|uniref:hypothetical protein n=1 Tax=Kitasatospora TaxID=2063 RepID=UPI0028B0367A|nr:hypothetical protein [Kitasatospora sp. CM 4170]WNM46996.1 hypothetical protein RMN57_20955 [Kitasatospora sp. CM 4170]